MIYWNEGGQQRSAKWHSENGITPHQKIQIGDDTLTADAAYRLACEGTAILFLPEPVFHMFRPAGAFGGTFPACTRRRADEAAG